MVSDSTGRVESSDARQLSERHGLNILLAEDNSINQLVAVRMLTSEGHRVTVAENGRKALAALQQQPFDLVLMDVQMPEMDGFESTLAIRAQEQKTGAHVPIIAMTAHAIKGDRERCLAAGMDGYVSKPVNREDLRRTIQSIVPAAEKAGHEAVMDYAAALVQFDGDAAFLHELASMLAQDAPQALTEIQAAIAQRDSDRLQRSAHKLKGSLIPFVAPPAIDAAQELESIGQSQDLAKAEDVCRRLGHELDRLLTLLASLTATRTAPNLNQAVVSESSGDVSCPV